jgi:hypothetical protein
LIWLNQTEKTPVFTAENPPGWFPLTINLDQFQWWIWNFEWLI